MNIIINPVNNKKISIFSKEGIKLQLELLSRANNISKKYYTDVVAPFVDKNKGLRGTLNGKSFKQLQTEFYEKNPYLTPEIENKLKNLDALLIEENHDISMLEAGPYPWTTKNRIKSGLGHLSNDSCGELLASVTHSNLKRVVLMHMSETNNHPELAKITAQQALGETSPELILAQQNHPTELFSI